MKPFKTEKKDNFVDRYVRDNISHMENITVEDVPLFVNGVKITQEGSDGTYLIIYQEIASDIVVMSVHEKDGNIVNKSRAVYQEEKKEWKFLPQKIQ